MAIKPDLAEIKRLADIEGSCVRIVEKQVTLMLHPMYTQDVKKGIIAELDGYSDKYSVELGGFPLAYESAKLLSRHGWFFHTHPYNHLLVSAKFYVFAPEVGTVLEGIVKKKTKNHLGCLVHGTFNVSVPAPHDREQREGWCGDDTEEGDCVKMKLYEVRFSFYLLHFKAELDPESVKEAVQAREASQASDTPDTPKKILFNDDSGISSNEADEESKASQKRAKGGKASGMKREENGNETQMSGMKQEENGNETPGNSAKKKKKKKKVDESINEDNFADSFEIKTENFEGVLEKTPKQKKKKSKLDKSISEILEELPKTKNKKNKLNESQNNDENILEKTPKSKKKNNKLNESQNVDENILEILEKTPKQKNKKSKLDKSKNEENILESFEIKVEKLTPKQKTKKNKLNDSKKIDENLLESLEIKTEKLTPKQKKDKNKKRKSLEENLINTGIKAETKINVGITENLEETPKQKKLNKRKSVEESLIKMENNKNNTGSLKKKKRKREEEEEEEEGIKKSKKRKVDKVKEELDIEALLKDI